MMLPTCDLRKICPQIAFSMAMAVIIYEHYNLEATFTSVCDGKHGPGSLHASGRAFDLRIKDLDGNERNITESDRSKARQIILDLKNSLGTQFDIVLESDHIHIEYDPK